MEELPQEQELPEELPQEQELPQEEQEPPQLQPPQLQPPRREVFLSRMMTRMTAAATAARIATLAKFINKLLYITPPRKAGANIIK